MKQLLITAFLITLLASCYRMPSEGEVSVVPNTNNPQLIHKESSPWAPGVDM